MSFTMRTNIDDISAGFPRRDFHEFCITDLLGLPFTKFTYTGDEIMFYRQGDVCHMVTFNGSNLNYRRVNSGSFTLVVNLKLYSLYNNFYELLSFLIKHHDEIFNDLAIDQIKQMIPLPKGFYVDYSTQTLVSNARYVESIIVDEESFNMRQEIHFFQSLDGQKLIPVKKLSFNF